MHLRLARGVIVFCLALVFSPGVPALLAVALLYFVCGLCADKFLLLRKGYHFVDSLVLPRGRLGQQQSAGARGGDSTRDVSHHHHAGRKVWRTRAQLAGVLRAVRAIPLACFFHFLFAALVYMNQSLLPSKVNHGWHMLLASLFSPTLPASLIDLLARDVLVWCRIRYFRGVRFASWRVWA